MKSLKIFGILFFGIVLGLLAAWTVAAAPTGPSSITTIGSSRMPISAASNTSAIAGNVTGLDFESNSVTNTWQGYYGNISGSIKLGNAANQTLYDWTSASPNGEIYATRASGVPAWASVVCATDAQIATEDTTLGVNQTVDQDAVNRTFLNTTSFNQFYVGNVVINNTQNCYAVNLNNESGLPSTDFQELLLHDGASLIYTTIIKQDASGFDGGSHDFEMLVGEDGHNGDANPTPYYFYVELG